MSAFRKGAFAIVLLLVALICLRDNTSHTAVPVTAPVPGLKQDLLSPEDRAIAAPPALFYRHSVIPGGVRHALELRSVLARDRFAKVHFAQFDAANAYVVHVKSPRLVHVSYRIGDEIYWTKKKLRLKTGEALLTDGKTFVRTRCGNRIADVPQPKVSVREPPPEQFDMVIPPPGGASPNRIPKASPLPPSPPVHQDDTRAPPHVWDRSPPLSPLPPPINELPDDAPTPVPEPGAFSLVLLALFSLFWNRRRNRQKKGKQCEEEK